MKSQPVTERRPDACPRVKGRSSVLFWPLCPLFFTPGTEITGRAMTNGCGEKCRVINGQLVAKSPLESLIEVEHLFTCTLNGKNTLFPMESLKVAGQSNFFRWAK